MARRHVDPVELKGFLGGIDLDSDPFDIPDDCLISTSNVLPSLSVGAITVINGYTVQNPNSVLQSHYMKDQSGNYIKDQSGNIRKGQ
jgi:hypothetical protein